MNREELLEYLQLYLDAYMDCDIDVIKSFHHPEYKCIDGSYEFGTEHKIERAKLAKKTFGTYFVNIIGAHVLSQNSSMILVYFFGHDKILNKACEKHGAIYSEVKDDKVYKEFMLSDPPLDTAHADPFTDTPIENKLKKRLIYILNHQNYSHISLSAKQLECLFLYLLGDSYELIGKKLYISKKTVDSHLNAVKDKCNLFNMKELKKLFKLVK